MAITLDFLSITLFLVPHYFQRRLSADTGFWLILCTVSLSDVQDILPSPRISAGIHKYQVSPACVNINFLLHAAAKAFFRRKLNYWSQKDVSRVWNIDELWDVWESSICDLQIVSATLKSHLCCSSLHDLENLHGNRKESLKC